MALVHSLWQDCVAQIMKAHISQSGNLPYAISMIERLMDRKSRNGEWEPVIQREGQI